MFRCQSADTTLPPPGHTGNSSPDLHRRSLPCSDVSGPPPPPASGLWLVELLQESLWPPYCSQLWNKPHPYDGSTLLFLLSHGCVTSALTSRFHDTFPTCSDRNPPQIHHAVHLRRCPPPVCRSWKLLISTKLTFLYNETVFSIKSLKQFKVNITIKLTRCFTLV